MEAQSFTPAGLDALPPVEMARKAETIGVAKAGMSPTSIFALSVLAGAFIALGAIFATTAMAGGSDLPYGVVRLLGGLTFTLGLILAVWLTYGAHTTTDKILAIVPPIAAFVAAGFEHSVANMYFIPIGLFIKTDDSFVAGLDNAPDLSHLTWGSFLGDNLLPVTLGNIVGGGLMVGLVYWFVYLRPSKATA